MPRGDGTGPVGAGGRGRGRMGGPFSAGPSGQCVCLSCGHRINHTPGQPCNRTACPKCATMMTRQTNNNP